jgi:DNA polymerase I-like protein with 3'-5' exonuclease and polymerase domains/uracil-DNA glycosylase
LSECENCPLKGRPKVVGRGVKYGYTIVGDFPSYYEAAHQMLFVGKVGDVLREALKAVEVSPDTLYVTTRIPCYPEKAYDEETLAQATQHCRTRHVHEVRHQHPRGVITFGDRYPWRWDDDYRTWIMGTLHPIEVVRDESNLPLLLQDLSQLKIGPPEPRNPLPDVKYALVEDELDVANLYGCIDILNSSLHTIDIETTGLDAQDSTVICLGIAASPHDIWIVTAPMIPHLKELLENEDLNWAGHNVYQFDCKFLELQYGIKCKPKYDTMLMSYNLDERPWGHSLKVVAMEYFHIPNWSTDMDMANLAEYAPELLYTYLAYDCYFTWNLVDPLLEEMDEEDVTHIHNMTLIPASRTLAQIEMRGAYVDQDYLSRTGDTLVEELRGLGQQLCEAAQTPAFNPNSRQQVQKLLYDTLQIPSSDRRVDKLALQSLSHPVIDLLLEYKLKYKLLSTFIMGLLSHANKDGIIHPHFLLHATVTGRLSSRAPNLQNMPVVTGSIIRDAFIAPPGKVLVEVDYAQLELKIAAWYSGDVRLQGIYKSGGDAHVLAAAAMYKVPIESVTKEQRYHAKHVAFGILYGRGANSLALSILHCPPNEAQRFINDYFKQFSGLWKWIRKMQRQALRLGYVKSAFGRKRRFPAILSEYRGDIERKASNMPIQSMASDICLAGLIRLEEVLDPVDAEVILTVHDSILLNVCPDKVSYIIKTIKRVLEKEVPYADEIPLTVDFGVGSRWGSLLPPDEWRASVNQGS